MGIADADPGEGKRLACGVDGLLDQLAGREGARECGWPERGPAHFDGDGARIPMPVHVQRNRHQPAFGLDGEVFLFRLAGRVKIAGKDAQAVAGFFRLAAVRVEDAQAEVRFLRRDQRKDPIAAQAPISVAHGFDVRGRQLEGQLLGVHHEVVVAEAMAAEECVLHS